MKIGKNISESELLTSERILDHNIKVHSNKINIYIDVNTRLSKESSSLKKGDPLRDAYSSIIISNKSSIVEAIIEFASIYKIDNKLALKFFSSLNEKAFEAIKPGTKFRILGLFNTDKMNKDEAYMYIKIANTIDFSSDFTSYNIDEIKNVHKILKSLNDPDLSDLYNECSKFIFKSEMKNHPEDKVRGTSKTLYGDDLFDAYY